jgi:hypothetical protein
MRDELPLHKENEPKQPDQTLFALAVSVTPFTGWTFLHPGVYHLTCQLAAENVSPQTFTVEINHTGRWLAEEAKMLGDGVALKLVS